VHISDNCCIVYKFYESRFKTCFHDLITFHLHVSKIFLPQVIHDLEELQSQIILSKIITAFKQKLQLALLVY
jgi:hypothetical protein